jgi:hypothetical protein
MSAIAQGVKAVVPIERVERAIFIARGHRVIFDETLAQLYGVSTKRLNEQVRRNSHRFPDDFMFQLASDEWASLRSQIATLRPDRGQHRKYLPCVFTEHGAVMAANVLNSPTAVQASIQVVRAFVRLRQLLASHEELARKLEALERKYDKRFRVVFDTIRALMTPPETKRRPIGFRLDAKG